MSGHTDQRDSGNMLWTGPAPTQLPITGFPYLPPRLLLQQPQTQDAYSSSGLLLESHLSLPQTHGQRQDDSRTRNILDIDHVPATLAATQGSSVAQSILEPRPTHQRARGKWPITNGTEDGDNTSPQRLSRRQRTRQPGEGQWQQNKVHIERLYMKENLALPEVMRLMERDHDFVASERMYKNKFKIWRWSKNLPHGKAAWMAEKAQQRMPRLTTFYWNHQEWTEEKLRQKSGKPLENPNNSARLVSCAPTPMDIDYETPPTLAASPQQPRTAASRSQVFEDQQNEQAPFYLDNLPVNLDLSQTTMSDLRILLNEASRAASAGNVDEANADFRDVVSGFSSLLSPTHEETLRAGYLYASFYANCANMVKADAVLQWMSQKHIERWGPGHEKTYLHYARMIELFRSWGRQEHAELPVYKVLDDTKKDNGDALSTFNGPRPGRQHRHSIAGIDLEPTTDPEAISAQLDNIDLATITSIAGLDNVLETTIRHCEDNANDLDMALQASRAKCQLAKLHIAAGRTGETHRVLNSARKSLVPLLVVEREPMSRTIAETAQRLSRLYLEAKDHSSCNAVLDQVIASLYARRSVPSCEAELEDAFLLDFVLSIAFEFHQALSWDACRYWVERGLGLAIRMHGRKSSEARRFQKILDKQDFGMRTTKTVADLMKCSGGVLRI